MNVLMVADRFFGDHAGGLARVAWDVAQLIANEGHRVDLLCMRVSEKPFPKYSERIGAVTVHRVSRPSLPPWHPDRHRAPVRVLKDAITDLAANSRFDIVHYHSIFTGAAARAALPSPPRTVFTIHSPVVLEQRITWKSQGVVGLANLLFGIPIVRRMERQLLQSADRCHVLSEFTAESLRKQHPSVKRNYDVVPHWVRPDWLRTIPKPEARKALGWPDDSPLLFTVRGLRPRYGIADAIEAVAPLAKAGNCRFFIAGDGPDRGTLAEQIKHANVSDRIHLLGAISDDALKLAYQAADLFILPTRELECFGLIALESLAYGLPLVATAVGAIPEIVRPILPDFLVPPFSPQSLRNVVQRYLRGELVAPSSSEMIEYGRSVFGMERARRMYHRLYGMS